MRRFEYRVIDTGRHVEARLNELGSKAEARDPRLQAVSGYRVKSTAGWLETGSAGRDVVMVTPLALCDD